MFRNQDANLNFIQNDKAHQGDPLRYLTYFVLPNILLLQEEYSVLTQSEY